MGFLFMHEPFLSISTDFVSVYSGDSGDAIPIIAFSLYSNAFTIKIPGGRSIVIKPEIAARFALEISSLAQKVVKEAEFQGKVDYGYFDWIEE